MHQADETGKYLHIPLVEEDGEEGGDGRGGEEAEAASVVKETSLN